MMMRIEQPGDALAEHYEQAAALLAGIHTFGPQEARDPAATVMTAAAHTHATLALTAAIVTTAPATARVPAPARSGVPWGRLAAAAGVGAGVGVVLALYGLLGLLVLGVWP